MADDRRVSGSYPHELAKVRAARVAKRQHNRIASHQLTRLGAGGSTVRDWMRAGYLHRRLRGVYAVGSPARTTESDLFEAVLYAGPGAMLSHVTGAWWLGLIDHPSPAIHVSTPRRRTSPRGILVHKRRIAIERVIHDGIPTTTVAQTLLDLAAMGELKLVRRGLARLDYEHRFDPHALLAVCEPGHRGSSTLRWAIAHFDPRFAFTRSPLEDDWLICCEQLDIPKPDDVNVEICGIPVDACYYDAKLIIEFDGTDNHRSPAQVRRDRLNEYILRTAQWMVLRYTSDLIRDNAAGVRAEVLHNLATRAGLGSALADGAAAGRR
jgi:Protein of unknown function (DUF559)